MKTMRGREVAPARVDGAAARAVEALRRAGGALPVERLYAEIEAAPTPPTEPVAPAVRRRDDLFLLIDRPPEPWRDEQWAPGERAEYDRGLGSGAAHVLLLDGSAALTPRAPVLLRESLLSMWSEAPQDDELRRELARAAAFGGRDAGVGRNG